MSRNKEFHDYIVFDVLKEISGISSRPMFSGWGIYKDGKIFALIIDGELFFKVNKNNQPEFKRRGSHPFSYSRNGKIVELSYWVLPDEILEDKKILAEWISKSIS